MMLIKFENLSKEYIDGSQTLSIIKNLNFELNNPKDLAIVGKSGIGKSTFLHLLAGIEKASSGSLFVNKIDLNSLSADQLAEYRLNNIGLVFQFHHLLNEFTAEENVSLPLLIKGINENTASQLAKDFLSLVGLSKRLKHRPGELSGGEQQRVAIARALVHSPKLLLADEPTGSLDFQTSEEIASLLLDICRKQEIALITVTHNLDFARRFTKVFRMECGGSLNEEI